MCAHAAPGAARGVLLELKSAARWLRPMHGPKSPQRRLRSVHDLGLSRRDLGLYSCFLTKTKSSSLPPLSDGTKIS